YGISRTTLQSRQAGRSSAQTGHHYQQRLSLEQERILCDWILELEVCGYAPSHSQPCEMATCVLVSSGDLVPLGKN
ncbi:hypothetical protein C7212DRAFT_29442, partial [Tuber magnatum]